MSMDYEVAFSIGGDVDSSFDESQAAEIQAMKLFQKLVMVAGDKCDAGMLPIFAEQLLDENIIVLRPMPLPAQLPAIYEIADEIELLAFCFTEKIKQFADLGMPGSQVNV